MNWNTRRDIHWHWPTESEFFSELARELGTDSLTQDLKEEVRRKLARYVTGLSRVRKDHKELVGFRAQSMIELRLTVIGLFGERNLRLILSHQPAGIYVLRWHVKDPAAAPHAQRHQMNEAVKQAIKRLEGLNIDKDGPNV